MTKKCNPYVNALVRRAYIQVIGTIWMPPITATQSIALRDYDLENIGTFTRANVLDWLGANAGDFQSIKDFRAVCGAKVIGWRSEESEMEFNELTYPEEE